ncbi:MAG: asparaginase domain-containing protein [Pseudomonadota bacterium]
MIDHITFLTTGGTIDKVYFDAKSTYEIGESVVSQVLPDGLVTFSYTVQSLMQKDSLELTDDDRAAIVAAAKATPSRRIIVTHGTDTMVDTGRALEAVTDKVIVLTGALTPGRFRETDAVFNLGLAVGAVQSLPPGVYVAMSGQVFGAGDVRKNRDENRFERVS